MNRNVFVTGLGMVSAAGDRLPAVMESLYRGRRDPAPPLRIRADLPETYPVFEIRSDLDGLLQGDGAIDATRTAKLALIAAREALVRAGIDPSTVNKRRIGVCLGTTLGCVINDETVYRLFREGGHPPLDPVRRFLKSNPAPALAKRLGLTGPAVTVANACSSGTDAVGLARWWIRSGRCDLVLAGGADELGRSIYIGFASLMIASTRPCRPFDKDRNGLNLGEGAGILLLESDESARARGAAALAECSGYGSAADLFHPISPHPEARGLRRAIDHALMEAKVAPDRIGFVNAHGTSTEDNDRVEGALLFSLFSGKTPVVSTKAYTGHAMGASGGIEAVLTVQALMDQKLPATAGFETPDPACGIVPTTENRSIDATWALSTSMGFGGNNAALVFRRAR